MLKRSNRLMGKVWGDSNTVITVHYNGVQVYLGAVPTILGTIDVEYPWNDMDILCEWRTGTTMVNGEIPVSITITNGDMLVQTIMMNHVDPVLELWPRIGMVWPRHVPKSWDEVINDCLKLPGSDFSNKYGISDNEARSSFDRVMVATSEEYMVPRVHLDRDAKHSIKLDGAPCEFEHVVGEGEASIAVPNHSTLEFMFTVRPVYPFCHCSDGRVSDEMKAEALLVGVDPKLLEADPNRLIPWHPGSTTY